IEGEIDQLFVSDGYVAYEEVLGMQEQTSVNIILETVAETSPFLPGKFPHCVAANKPILHLGPEKSEVKRLLGAAYPYHAKANDVDEIVLMLEKLYFGWKEDKEAFKLNRNDLQEYLSADHLKHQINNLD